MNKLFFAGHETFSCKQFWLKKGYDYLKKGFLFTDPIAVVELGVGKNMVNAIQFWLKAFGLLAEDNKILSEIAHQLFSDSKDAFDPYVESIGTVWLLHYLLIKTGKSSIYSLVFNYMRQERFEFNKNILFNFLLRKIQENKIKVSENTLQNDISVFFRTYIKPKKDIFKADIEEIFSGVLLDLDIIDSYEKMSIDGKITEWYKIPSAVRPEIPFHIILYVILEHLEQVENKTSITFHELEHNLNSPGRVFALTADGLYNKIEEIVNYSEGKIIYSQAGGVKVLQIKSSFTKTKKDVLYDYYNQ
jgi:hypothetical protein